MGLEDEVIGAQVREELIEEGVHNLRDHQKLEILLHEIIEPHIGDNPRSYSRAL